MPNFISRLLTWLCLLLGLAGSGAAGYWVKLETDTHEYHQFVSYSKEIKQEIKARLEIQALGQLDDILLIYTVIYILQITRKTIYQFD